MVVDDDVGARGEHEHVRTIAEVFVPDGPCAVDDTAARDAKVVCVLRPEEAAAFEQTVPMKRLGHCENDIGEFKTFLKLSPPLRLEEDRLALVQGVKDGLSFSLKC